ncbi:MAG TPA: hypothetical protein VHL11_01135, partial [Phototrophicaceae bacterium]|nr:hypothetical protein [Phototrophicaceae bacterium]
MTTSQPQPPVPKRRSRLRYALNLVAVGVIAFFAVLFLRGMWEGVANSDSYFRGGRVKLCCTPADNGLEYEDVQFKTEDGLNLRGWYLPSQNGVAILVAHGLSQTRENTFNIAMMLQKHG